MSFNEQWIWLPRSKYPAYMETRISALRGSKPYYHYAVADFKKEYSFKKKIKSVKLRVSADTFFLLYEGGRLIATGPAAPAGDFLRDILPKRTHYATEHSFTCDGSTLSFFARVRMAPGDIFEFSRGRGGFMLCAEVFFEDGSVESVGSDSTWQVRLNRAFVGFCEYDGRIKPDDYTFAEEIDDIWHTATAPIATRTETEISPDGCTFRVAPNEEAEYIIDYPMIYAGSIHAVSSGEADVLIDVTCRELDTECSKESIILSGCDEYRSFKLHSVGNTQVKVKNLSSVPSLITVNLIAIHYPVYTVAHTETSDCELDGVLKLCEHTLRYCRQTLHLDSPKHCEPLACTGDYYVETLMSAFAYGDMDLAKLDIRRTADLFRENDGRIFHTTYSLIWVRWLYDVYMLTGDKSLLYDCEDALKLLLDRFKTYMGENGILEYAPDYMFVDWIYVDGYSMHHPPKALGQSCLCMYYYGALDRAEKIYEILGNAEAACETKTRRENLREAIDSLLYNSERGLYSPGLTTLTPENLLDSYSMPQNTDKLYYIKQPNILAAAFGVCDMERSRDILCKIMTDECEGQYQPFFAHFLLEAVYRCGLRDEYTLKILDRWKPHAAECAKGLAEGFEVPEPGYVFDHSHAWGGTPLCSLPQALLGVEIKQPGMKRLSVSPSLLGLEYAKTELPTPYGMLSLEMKDDKCVIRCPEEIDLEVKCDAEIIYIS